MYDLKTHDADVVRANLPDYAQQLNIYAHIWKHLRGRTLDAMAIIATPPPREVREAISSNDPEALRKAFENWKPEVPIPFSDGEITDNIEQFGKVVDAIESAHFDPPGVERLERRDGHEDNFAARVCANCDARHSCTSFLAHVRTRKLKPRRKLVERSSRRRETGK